MKKKIEAILSNTEKAARDVIDNVTQAVDQNDDGKFDTEDVAAIAGTLGNMVKTHGQAIKESAEEKARQYEEYMLKPVFVDTLAKDDFKMSKFVRITERDKKRAESEVCQGSIGFVDVHNDYHVITIYSDSIESFGLSFYPDNDCEFYYVDPSDSKCYIALDDYFEYLKAARVDELGRIAQALGAKRYQITYKEEKASFSNKKARVKAVVAKAGTIDAGHDSENRKFSMSEIKDKASFPGKPPVEPELKYLKDDNHIKTLIAMRMDPTSPLFHKTYEIHLSQSTDMKQKEAVKIDGVLKGLKCNGDASVAVEANNETRRFLEYDIEF